MILKLKNNFMPTIENAMCQATDITDIKCNRSFFLHLEYIWVYTLIIIKKKNNKKNI